MPQKGQQVCQRSDVLELWTVDTMQASLVAVTAGGDRQQHQLSRSDRH